MQTPTPESLLDREFETALLYFEELLRNAWDERNKELYDTITAAVQVVDNLHQSWVDYRSGVN